MKDVTGELVKNFKTQGKKLLVQYTATWCQPCKMLTPRLEKIENNYEDVSFLKVNVETNMEHVSELGITSVPTVIIYNGETVVNRSVGVHPESFYEDILNTL